MKFKYIGNHPQITQHEITFERNQPVDVTGKKLKYNYYHHGHNEERTILVADKLKGNPDFEEVIEVNGNEFLPKKRGPKPKVKDGNETGYQESGFTQA